MRRRLLRARVRRRYRRQLLTRAEGLHPPALGDLGGGVRTCGQQEAQGELWDLPPSGICFIFILKLLK
eukprot:scaffold18338_cov122-Isochrysis_galbana.AAC.6